MILAYLKLLIASQLKPNLVNLARMSDNKVSHDQLTWFLKHFDAEKPQLERITNLRFPKFTGQLSERSLTLK